jgi:general secretion pathway protein L
MAENLFVRLPDTDEIDQLQWLLLDESSGVVRVRGEGGPDELTGFVQDAGWTGTTIVLAPSERVLLTSANVPSRKPRQIVQALPFVIEEQLASSVEKMHLAMGDRSGSGEINVAVVEYEILEKWLEALADTGLSPGVIVPEALCVPGRRNEVNILLDGTRALFRVGLSQGFAADRDQVSTFLGLLDDGAGDNVGVSVGVSVGNSVGNNAGNSVGNNADNSVGDTTGVSIGIDADGEDESRQLQDQRGFRLHSDQTDEEEVLFAQWQAELNGALQKEPLDYPPFETLCREYSGKSTINLLQGDFKPQSADSASRANWGAVAALVLVGFLLHVFAQVGQGVYMNTQADQYQAQAQQLYKDVFPKDRNVRDLRRRWRSHLNGSGNSKVSNDFLSMFSASAAELKGTRVQLGNVSFSQKRGDLILQVRAPDSDQVVAYSQKLTAAGLRSEIGIINQEADGVKGSIRIRGFRGPGT